jgi:hypothetical protein
MTEINFISIRKTSTDTIELSSIVGFSLLEYAVVVGLLVQFYNLKGQILWYQIL